MQYISPYRLLNLSKSDNLDLKMLESAQEKMLIEVEKSDSKTITINDTAFTKDEIVALFEGFKKVEHFEFHKLLFQETDVLEYLEQNKIPYHGKISDKKVYQYKSSFIDFVTPYFAHRYIGGINEGFITNNADFLKDTTMIYPVLMSDSFLKKAKDHIVDNLRIVEEKLRTFEVDLEKGFVVDPAEEVMKIVSHNMLAVFKDLPIEFDYKLDKLSLALMDLSVEFLKINDNDTAQYLFERSSEFAKTIKTKAIITKLGRQSKVFVTANVAHNKTSDDGLSPFAIIAIVLFVLRILISLSRR
jgi:hypothetical protein